ncbi:hypothetical protein PoB_001661700 [Plakobranchus ocellatus]|uniref:Uncharacterized protein n=1 Tax=Plakobranchus ocellatus TaxID=259542 RepID=A0AAV3Z6E0_9GAST|nr:hypothetical protein PoB_001661700 [Plakobranchus ocellatus]
MPMLEKNRSEFCVDFCVYSSPQQDDLRLSGSSSGQGACGTAQLCNRRVPKISGRRHYPLSHQCPQKDRRHLAIVRQKAETVGLNLRQSGLHADTSEPQSIEMQEVDQFDSLVR